MKTTEMGQSLVETVILSVFITTGIIAVWSIYQKSINEYVEYLLALIGKPMP